jgi:TolB-like protein
VLPFKCTDDDPTAAQFADGLTMEVMTELVKLSGLFLASDFSTLRYRREAPSAQAVSRELGVRFLLEGTVRRSGERLRVNAQLVDAMNGKGIWAERYENTLDDIFGIQDSITDSIIAALDVRLVSGRRSHITRQSLRNREALRHYYNGWSHLISGSREDLILAQRDFETAAELEPESPLPPSMASWTYWWQGFRVLAHDSKSAFERQALEDPNGFASLVMAHVHLLRAEHDQALAAAQHALNLRPSCDVRSSSRNGRFDLPRSLLRSTPRFSRALTTGQDTSRKRSRPLTRSSSRTGTRWTHGSSSPRRRVPWATGRRRGPPWKRCCNRGPTSRSMGFSRPNLMRGTSAWRSSRIACAQPGCIEENGARAIPERVAVATGGNGKGAKSCDDWGWLAARLMTDADWDHPVSRDRLRLPDSAVQAAG